MTQQHAHRLVFAILVLSLLAICPAAETPDPSDPNRYLNAIRTFADNVLKYGRDTYGPKHTPLSVDGLNVHTREPVKWIDPDGKTYIIRDLHRVVPAKCRLWSLLNRLGVCPSNS